MSDPLGTDNFHITVENGNEITHIRVEGNGVFYGYPAGEEPSGPANTNPALMIYCEDVPIMGQESYLHNMIHNQLDSTGTLQSQIIGRIPEPGNQGHQIIGIVPHGTSAATGFSMVPDHDGNYSIMDPTSDVNNRLFWTVYLDEPGSPIRLEPDGGIQDGKPKKQKFRFVRMGGSDKRHR